ncbi:hypothetical protein Hanom_Chr11g01047561 [Helianthus anomalus]
MCPPPEYHRLLTQPLLSNPPLQHSDLVHPRKPQSPFTSALSSPFKTSVS